MSGEGVYFNEHDKFAAQWLRNLWPDATVDERDIQDVRPDELVRYRRCHFFGGIGGWEYALELAEWPQGRSIWTGSCPCQPFSSAGKRKGVEDERHLWPTWFRLIRECRPDCIIGEQVESAIGHGWLDGVSGDLEAEGYAVGAVVLGAHSVGAPHVRQRLYWVAESESARGWQDVGTVRSGSIEGLRESQGQNERWTGEQARRIGDCSSVDRISDAGRERLERLPIESTRQELTTTERSGVSHGMEFTENTKRRQDGGDASAERKAESESRNTDSWNEFLAIKCHDDKWRRISTQPGDEPLAYGIPRDVGQRIPELRPLAKNARANRVGRLRGYGNAIVPQVAAEFIRAFMLTQDHQP